MKEVPYIIILGLLIVGCANAQVVIPCNFNQTVRGYECRLPDVDLSQFESFVIGGDTHLPGFNDGMVESFFSIHNNFRTFPTTHISRFQNLRHIKVSESLIEELPAGAIAGRPGLETLSLASNFISRIDPAAFSGGTTNLRSLNLMFNSLRTLDNTLYSLFPLLIDLDIGFNIIERIPPNIFSNNPNLINLNMNRNRVNFINQTFFANLPSLSMFQFSDNICYSGSFFGLELPANRANMMTRLQPCFIEGPSNFNCIFGFSFDGISFDNQYTCLLRGIEAYDPNREINLGGWHLAGQTNINVLFVWIHLSDTRFIISNVFTEFINLRGMNIASSNLLGIQQDAFRGANNLVHLTITMNNIRRLEANTFFHAHSLQEIFLWFNGLEYVNENAFAGLSNLRELHLYNGQLTHLAPNTFAPMWNLQFLEISSNQFEIIDSRWFTNNTFIRQLNFNNNLIHSIFPGLVDMPLLTNLQLLNNICVDAVFTITDANREQVRQQLNPCFINYPLRVQRFWMELEGDLAIYYANGTLVGNL